MAQRKRVLISNDDGINAPGLRALVEALVADNSCEVCVCGPADEQSAKSHAITLGRPLQSYPISVPDVAEAYAVRQAIHAAQTICFYHTSHLRGLLTCVLEPDRLKGRLQIV